MVNLKCCKTKPVPYYICTKCTQIFHQACVQRSKNKHKFLKSNKIICCEVNSEDHSIVERDLETNIMEKTIEDLPEDRLKQNRHITELKNEMRSLMEEALMSEEAANELIRNQENAIEEANLYINELLQTTIIMQSKPTNSISTQTSVTIKQKGMETKSVESQTYTGKEASENKNFF
ncbi:hypothetical protein JTB14_018279 [Gonioctena quinquepunctata]|nr:hypothetical protein JTB14_018279 [Gonioctena quinquepunctata]